MNTYRVTYYGMAEHGVLTIEADEAILTATSLDFFRDKKIVAQLSKSTLVHWVLVGEGEQAEGE